ncbi:MAG: MFS transporter [Paludibacterium sp.]|uniref:MFS transporter n=1 Tax=Paludibacterium sp. TaxID=1917523 RepID=UPI0025F37715|nr:MFS transporter [Paludibacterium sp.]MBV8046483.1 MFS transporter [Paludibacterium sp.]MBV8646563.1 MFS transporter [Paludibacterium sp.]
MPECRPGYLALVRNPAFIPLLLSQAITNLGDGLFAVVLVCVAVKIGASPGQLGVITCGLALPRGVLGPLGGVIADRTDKKRMLLAIEWLRSGVMILIAVLGGIVGLNVWALALAGLVVSALYAAAAPAARSLIPLLVPDGQLQLANSMVQGITWPAYFLGAGLFALAQHALAPVHLFFLVLGCFALSSLVLMTLPSRGRVTSTARLSSQQIVSDLVIGYRALRGHPVLYVRVMTYALYSFFWRGLLQVALPLLVLRALPLYASLYGALMLANGLCELVSNLVIGKIHVSRPLHIAYAGELIMGLAAWGMMLSAHFPQQVYGLYFAAVLVGISAALIDIPLMTELQRHIPQQHIGKVLSYWFSIGAVGGGAGSLICGLVLEHVALVPALISSGGLLGLFGVAMLMWYRRCLAPLPVGDGA